MTKSISHLLKFALLAILAFAGTAAAQDPGLDARRADLKDLQDRNRVYDGMEKDKAARRTKEERTAIVNEAFKRLQLLHNDFMTMMTSGQPIENSKLIAATEEIKQRAIELNANLALPQLPKQKVEKESPPAATMALGEQMSSVCSQIRDFVKNVNLSPTDPKFGVEARRNLAAIIEQSDKIILLINSPKPKG